MESSADDADFVLTVTEIFSITGRGTVVAGTIESGVLRTGNIVEIWDADELVTRCEVQVEFLCRPGQPSPEDLRTIALRVGDIDPSLFRPGQRVLYHPESYLG